MTDVTNPYTAPRARLDGAPADGSNGHWREGKELVMRIDGSLPERCVKCNERAVQPIEERRLYWHHPALFY